jgi:hypothetical protein
MTWDRGVSLIDKGNLLGKAAGVDSSSEYEGWLLAVSDFRLRFDEGAVVYSETYKPGLWK